MFSLPMRTSRYNIVYAWDREGQSNIVEIAKKEVNIINLKSLNIDVFLSKFEAWKSADLEQKQSLFASLREMHQAVGINKASTVFWADEEMLAFGDYVAQVKNLQQKTRVAILWVEPIGTLGDLQIKDEESLVSWESLVPVVPIVAPKKRRIRIWQRVKHDWNHKNLSHSPRPESGPEEKIDFSAEQKSLQNILQEVEKSSKLEYFSKFWNSKYRWESIDAIDYALQEQNDTEFYVYDKPKDGERLVYRTDAQNSIIDIVKVKMNNEVTVIKWSLFKPTYIPIILGTK